MTGRGDKENDEQDNQGARSPDKSQGKKVKGEKHVSFPPDEKIVSGFAEHKNTDRNADSNLTLTEVSLAYHRSCDRHQVEPSNHVLEQLKQATCVGGRVTRLDLQGERLDHRSCEALEVILKSLHFDFINLRAARLEENGASSLLDMILYYESTTHLDMSDNGSIGASGWRALAHLIKQSGSLSRLDLCDIAVVDYRAQSLAKALQASRLAVLYLDNTHLSGTPLFSLVGALKANRYLKELHLSGNQLNCYQDSMQLGDLLRYNNTLQILELNHNAVADAGLEELCEGLRWQTAGLKVLLLRNNRITFHGMDHLAKTLPALRVLEVLDLAENGVGNEGIQMLKEPLISNHSLRHLGLGRSQMTCEGAVALAEYLAESRQLVHLDLRDNDVRVGGLMALSLALRINCSLTTLDLDPTPLDEQEEFLMATQVRLRAEMAESCSANAGRVAVATESTAESRPPCSPTAQSDEPEESRPSATPAAADEPESRPSTTPAAADEPESRPSTTPAAADEPESRPSTTPAAADEPESRPSTTNATEDEPEPRPTATPTLKDEAELRPTATPSTEDEAKLRPLATPTPEEEPEPRPTATPTTEEEPEPRPSATPATEEEPEPRPSATPATELTSESRPLTTTTPVTAGGDEPESRLSATPDVMTIVRATV